MAWKTTFIILKLYEVNPLAKLNNNRKDYYVCKNQLSSNLIVSASVICTEV